jgi:ABC-type polysaccharide/polyol phosphate export permease
MNTSVYSEVQAIHRFWLIWYSLASQDIKLRYRRSVLGPLWITIGTAVTIYTTGFLYGNLFHIQLDHYFPYLASGIIGWAFISILIQESCNVFIEAENYIKNQESHMSLFMMRLISRNCLVFLHNLLVLIPTPPFTKVPLSIPTSMIFFNGYEKQGLIARYFLKTLFLNTCIIAQGKQNLTKLINNAVDLPTMRLLFR